MQFKAAVEKVERVYREARVVAVDCFGLGADDYKAPAHRERLHARFKCRPAADNVDYRIDTESVGEGFDFIGKIGVVTPV